MRNVWFGNNTGEKDFGIIVDYNVNISQPYYAAAKKAKTLRLHQ